MHMEMEQLVRKPVDERFEYIVVVPVRLGGVGDLLAVPSSKLLIPDLMAYVDGPTHAGMIYLPYKPQELAHRAGVARLYRQYEAALLRHVAPTAVKLHKPIPAIAKFFASWRDQMDVGRLNAEVSGPAETVLHNRTPSLLFCRIAATNINPPEWQADAHVFELLQDFLDGLPLCFRQFPEFESGLSPGSRIRTAGGHQFNPVEAEPAGLLECVCERYAKKWEICSDVFRS